MGMEKKKLSCLLNSYNFIVPEIQREYVWGTKKNNHVLIQFLNDLNEKLAKGDANIGFLYSYRSGSEHYLIDGQQRYTTIILLLHFLSKNGGCVSGDFVRQMRIDNATSAFSYRVRTYTESFLTHLLKSNATNEKDVMDQKWFKKEYVTDTTIAAMLGALDVFTENVKYLDNLTSSNVMEKVYFWYFDVEQTSQGEELYITMNSRGEKLTDSEQIKPRLLNNVKNEISKHRFGKEWDNWEEFFYKENLRGTRKVELINEAMNNVVRIVLELKTSGEHDRIKPVEDAELISIEDIKTYMDAIMFFEQYESGFYKKEIERLYGDSKEDGNFYVLKGLLTEKIKGQTDAREYLRVYQTILNQVRRNKIRNKEYLTFLDNYRVSPLSFYDFIIKTDETENRMVINGHELEKVTLCSQLGEAVENGIWKEQSNPFWNGDIKQLLFWAQKEGELDFSEFTRVSNNFNLLFDKSENVGWTSDNVRQALITRRMPFYPLDNCFFGYKVEEWKRILHDNQGEIKHFLDAFDGADVSMRDEIIASMKESYPEIQENKWAEFVHHNYLLKYCNRKRVQYRDEYGWECVQNAYKQPYSVRNMHLMNFLEGHISELNEISSGWLLWNNPAHWMSVIGVYRNYGKYSFSIQYRKDKGDMFMIRFNNKCEGEEAQPLSQTAINLGFVENEGVYSMYVPSNYESVLSVLKRFIELNPE